MSLKYTCMYMYCLANKINTKKITFQSLLSSKVTKDTCKKIKQCIINLSLFHFEKKYRSKMTSFDEHCQNVLYNILVLPV